MVTLTENAATKIKEIAEGEGVPASIRAKVRGGECAGFTYELDFDAQEKELDEVFGTHGVAVLVDPMSLQYLDGTVIDYEENKLGSSGFRFNNPSSTGSCGCGNSFSA
jgi:iron-sulfur cluster insertion protein